MNSKEKIKNIKCLINEFYHDMKCRGKLSEDARKCWLSYQKDCDDIEQDLDKLEKLEKELNQTKSNFKNSQTHSKDLYKKLRKQYEIINFAHNAVCEDNNILLNEIAKLKKVIEILKDKIIHHFIKYAKSLNDYNKFIRESEYDELTQEEYNLLKEHFGK